MLNLKDECNKRGLDSSLVGFNIGMLIGAQVPDIDERSSCGSVLAEQGLRPLDSVPGSRTLLPFPWIPVGSSLPSRFLISSTEVRKIGSAPGSNTEPGLQLQDPASEVRPILLGHHPQVWVEAEEL